MESLAGGNLNLEGIGEAGIKDRPERGIILGVLGHRTVALAEGGNANFSSAGVVSEVKNGLELSYEGLVCALGEP